jgi:hypothetical protein
MGVELLTERYEDQIAGVLSCYDRIIIQGTVPGWCYASGMTKRSGRLAQANGR